MILVKMSKKRAVAYGNEMAKIYYQFLTLQDYDCYPDIMNEIKKLALYTASELDITEEEAIIYILTNRIKFEVEEGYIRKTERERKAEAEIRKEKERMSFWNDFY